MNRLFLRGTSRQWLTRLHRWSGLVVMTCLVVAASTGTWLVFRPELDHWLNPLVRGVTPAAALLPADDLVARVEALLPDASVSTLGFQQHADETVLMSLRARGTAAPMFDQVFVNPYTGEIVERRDSTRLTWSKESLDRVILRLHYSLLMKAWGSWVMGVAAVVWVISNLIGLALAWPRQWYRPTAWRSVVAPRLTTGAYRANYDLHRTGGVLLLPVLTALAFTSVMLNAPQYVRPLVNALSPLTGPAAGTRVRSEEAVVSFGRAADTLRQAMPSARITNIYRDLTNGRHSIYFYLPGDVNPQGDNFAYVDLRDGRLQGFRMPGQLAAGDRFMSWLFPLHTGVAFGMPGRVLVAFTGLVIVMMNGTGLYLWWTRRRVR